jgi:hypothetical protein
MSSTFNKSGKQDDHEEKERSDNHQEGAEDKGENGDAEDASLDHNKMLKDIKVSNNKLNMVTLGVILIFLTYFSACFGISLNYLSQIDSYVTTLKSWSDNLALLQYWSWLISFSARIGHVQPAKSVPVQTIGEIWLHMSLKTKKLKFTYSNIGVGEHCRTKFVRYLD